MAENEFKTKESSVEKYHSSWFICDKRSKVNVSKLVNVDFFFFRGNICRFVRSSHCMLVQYRSPKISRARTFFPKKVGINKVFDGYWQEEVIVVRYLKYLPKQHAQL